MKFPNKEQVDCVKAEYKIGSVVEIISMFDPYRNMPKGTKGIVTAVDDTGTVFAKWTNNSSLGAIYGEDVIRIVKLKSDIIKTQTRLIANGGKFNMFSTEEVLNEAINCGFGELADFILEHKNLYGNLILTGELPTEIDET
jgi:hypothetical protein